jgi:uncharacterized membrane protein HdeD (DUF308 family)
MTSQSRSGQAEASAKTLRQALADGWLLLLARGIAAVSFGILTFAWPGATVSILVLLCGAFALVDGICAVLAASAGAMGSLKTWWAILSGVAGIAAGLITFFWPSLTAIALLFYIGIWAIVHGVLEIFGAIQLRKEIDNERLLVAGGLLSILFGLVMLLAPKSAVLALIFTIGGYAIAYGLLLIVFSLRIRSYREVSSVTAGKARYG